MDALQFDTCRWLLYFGLVMKTLVIGYGSIGRRHVDVLRGFGHDVAVLSRRPVDFSPLYGDLRAALSAHKPEYIVVANRTSEHFVTLSHLLQKKFNGKLLIEKPLFDNWREMPQTDEEVYVAYNLRFHPAIQRLRELLKGERPISAQAYVGQLLPQWRPHVDYRTSYSAKKEEGGGVLRDLSHELDYLNWLFGGWQVLTATGGHHSHLEIDTDDVYSVLFQAKNCPVVTVQMNYLDRVLRRELIVNTEQKSIFVDLVKGIVKINDKEEDWAIERDASYEAQHRAVIDGENRESLCTLEQGLDVLRMIEAAQKANREKIWVMRKE